MGRYREEISRETFEQIEHYLLNRMGEQVRLQFEAAMAADVELAAEVKLQQQLFALVEAGSFSINEQHKLPAQINRDYTLWYAAAAVILLVGALSFWFFKRTSGNTVDLYALCYQPDAGLPVEMGAADSTHYLFYDGMISYKEGNYAEALAKWNKLDTGEIQKDTLQYYMGMACLNKGNTDESIKILTISATRTGTAFYEQANWYLALAYIKKGDNEAAVAVLKKIKNYPGALSLLNKLQEE
ncbi:MAG: tetratricopeptide repeat protein [Sphingobacteriaceae bacterium]